MCENCTTFLSISYVYFFFEKKRKSFSRKKEKIKDFGFESLLNIRSTTIHSYVHQSATLINDRIAIYACMYIFLAKRDQALSCSCIIQIFCLPRRCVAKHASAIRFAQFARQRFRATKPCKRVNDLVSCRIILPCDGGY